MNPSFNIESKSLTKALDTLRPLFSKTFPMVFIRSRVDHVYLSTNDAETYCCIKLPCSGMGSIDTCVSGPKLLGRVKNAAGEATFTLHGTVLKFDCGAMEATLITASPDELPKVAEFAGAMSPVNGPELATAIKRVSPFMYREGGREELKGICFDNGSLVATNGRAMAACGLSPFEGRVTLSASVMGLLSCLSEDAQIGVSQSSFNAQDPRMQIIGAVIASPFPKWTDYFEGERPVQITVNREEMRDAVEYCSGIQVSENRSIVRMEAGDEGITISSKAEDGDAKASISGSATAYYAWAFDASYIFGLLQHSVSKEITFQCKDNCTSILVEDAKLKSAIWPIRLA